MGWNALCHNAARTDDCPFANFKFSTSAASNDRMRPDKCFSLNYHLTSSSGVGDNHSANANLNSVMNLDVLRIFIIEVDVISNKNIATYLNPASALEKRAQAGSAGTQPSENVQKTV
jgi:hypothetical protein